MSGLPSGQIVDYLIIGTITSILGTLLELFLKSNAVKPKMRFVAICGLIAVAVAIGYWRINGFPQPEANRGGGGLSTPTPTLSPTVPLITPSPTPRPTPTRESYADAFVRENIAPPGKGSRRNSQWAVVISDPSSSENYPRLATSVSFAIAETGQSTVAIFRPSATHGPAFGTLFAADPALARRLAEYCDHILLGKVTSNVQENPAYPGLLSLSLAVDVKIISTNSGDVRHQFQASAVGAGYSLQEARTNAEENLAANLGSEFRKAIRSE